MNALGLPHGLRQWLLAAAVAAVVFAALLGARRLFSRRLGAASAKADASALTDALHALAASTMALFLLALAVLSGARVLELGQAPRAWVEKGVMVVVFAQLARWGMAVLDRMLLVRRGGRQVDGVGSTLSGAAFLGRIVIVVVFALFALDNLGVNVSTLIAGLGVTSIAVALALQAILSDLFAALSIHFDKPFEIGDSITVGDLQGTVEHVGLRTTRLRALSGEQLVIGNRDLLASRIRNFQRMHERRVVLSFGLATGATPEALAEVPKVIEEVIRAQEQARFGRAHLVNVKDGAFMFETVYFMRVLDYDTFMDTQQAVYLALFDRFYALGLEFSYPVQRVMAEPIKA